jgi:hypothetical protein
VTTLTRTIPDESSATRKLSSDALCMAVLCEVCERKTTVFCSGAKAGLEAKYFQRRSRRSPKVRDRQQRPSVAKNGWGPHRLH